MHRACAALPVVTPFFCSGESNGFTDAVEQSRPRIDAKVAVLAVDAQGDRSCALDVGPVGTFRRRGALIGGVRVRRYALCEECRYRRSRGTKKCPASRI